MAARRREGRHDRRHPRYDVEGLSGNLRFTVEVEILDLSAGGMKVATRSHLGVGRTYDFNLVQGEEVVTVNGRIAWCELSGTRRLDNGDVVPTYTAGISFENVLTEHGRALVSLLEKTVVLEFQRRIFGRYQTAEEIDQAAASAELDFLVKRISMSGLLLEAELGAALESVLNLEVKLGDRLLICQGRVAFVEERAGGGYQMGIEFLDLAAEMATWLQEFIDSELGLEDD